MGEFSDVVVHVGYHKTGSTLLQNRLFVPMRGVYSEWPQSFYHRHLLLDRPDARWATRVRAAFGPGIELARAEGLLPVLSCEGLSGDIWRLGQANGYGNFHVAQLLAEAFPGARVAIVHREQNAMIASLFKHSLRSHWRFGLRQFLDQTPLDRGMAPLLNLGFLEYSHLVEHYQELLGPEHVLVLPFELLRHPEHWAERWRSFLGVEVHGDWFSERDNPGMSEATVRYKRFANYGIPATAEPNRTRIGRLVNKVAYQADVRVPAAARHRADAEIRRFIDAEVGRYFVEDNNRLAGLIAEDWSDFGYRR